ncbi:uncharacterized protein LY89DRAFT_395400 [Mollisia scopiformis]|uniref:Uncharacterized protein n=1 Tax=Mollisia scopiformis TaxID=149040 RepID=A0A194XR20_MOLSC|nr:uncharacterized protein LY89DRAFT_395400 [Mollisia scopiformis]KUJ22177.1 hypothetical protein LY89DRAFT_395400 [Mollisia scopiformis]
MMNDETRGCKWNVLVESHRELSRAVSCFLPARGFKATRHSLENKFYILPLNTSMMAIPKNLFNSLFANCTIPPTLVIGSALLSRRYGQKKEVHVHHLLCKHTFDVDLFEERRDVELREDSKGGYREVPRKGWPDTTYRTQDSSRLSHMLLGRKDL